MRFRLSVQVCPPDDILKQQKEPLSFDNNRKVDLFLLCRGEIETGKFVFLCPRSFWQPSNICERVSVSGVPNKDVRYILCIFLHNYVISGKQ